MKQVIQSVSGGPVRVLDVPRPTIGPTEVLVQTVASVISSGTERAMTNLAQSSLIAKAKARPDLVRQVVEKARTQGVGATVRAVRSRLSEDMPLGYSAAGIAVEVGDAVSHISPGQLVATGGAGKANHAEYQAVPGLLAAAVPEGVPAADAAFTTIASIALHGLRLADVGAGSKVVVIGLGIVGQLASRLAIASGCDVAGIDVSELPLRLAAAAGVRALEESGEATTEDLVSWSRGRGADAVLVCTSGKGSAVMARVPELCRDRASVVVVGDVGLELDRRPFYDRELTIKFSRSYGPGRYEMSYEEWGVDYPAGQLRWTEGRNFEAVLDLFAAGRLNVSDLVTHRFTIDEADAAYRLIESRSEPYLAIGIDYCDERRPEVPVAVAKPRRRSKGKPGIGWLGAGNFSTSTLLPAFRKAGLDNFVAIASASGTTSRHVAEQAGFQRAVSGAEAVLCDPDVDVVVIATPHSNHASLAEQAMRAGKHVWCEKPLALTEQELLQVEAAAAESDRVLFVGFNRRYSPAVSSIRSDLSNRHAPLTIVYRVAAGPVGEGHWYEDRRQGGRLIGEVCHFVDTSHAIVDRPLSSIYAVASNHQSTGKAQDYAVILSYVDGSITTISYSSALVRGEKEKVEVMLGTHHWTISDFRSLLKDGKEIISGKQDKGHTAAARTFADLMKAGSASRPDTASRDILIAQAATITTR